MKEKCSIVRELHVYGSVVPVNARDPTKFQHQGFGMLLMEEAERIARVEHRSIKIAVISGTFIELKNLLFIKYYLFQNSSFVIEINKNFKFQVWERGIITGN